MAFGISDLVNNIVDSVAGLAADLGIIPKSDKTSYPLQGPITPQIDTGKWNKTSPYVFSVENTDTGKPEAGFAPFELPINPTDLTQDETFSIIIKATQGGTVVQHSGNKYKDLVISGTTGIAPFRGAGGVNKSDGTAIFQPKDLKHKSGYEVFLHLRNYFRSYYQYKNDNKNNKAQLVFKNYKDGEFLIVELLKFNMKRSGARSFLYDYVLNFKVLGHKAYVKPDTSLLQSIDDLLNEVQNKLDVARGILYRSQDIVRQVEATYEATILEPLRKTALLVKLFRNSGNVIADLGRQAFNNTVSDGQALGLLLGLSKQPNPNLTQIDKANLAAAAQRADGANRLSVNPGAARSAFNGLFSSSDILMKTNASSLPESALNGLLAQQAQALQLPRSFFEQSIKDLKRVRDNAADKFNLNSPNYDSLVGRTSTLKADPAKVPTDKEFDVLNAFNQAIKAMEQFLSANTLFKSSYQQRIADVQAKFNNLLPLKAEQAVLQVILPSQMDLERLALTYLGNPDRWVEIAELNNLKPPYIIQDQSDTTPNVLHPGNKILVPAPVKNGFSNVPKAKPNYFTNSLSEVEKNLAVDLKITPQFDLEMTNGKDVQVAYGATNMAQAIVLKLMYQKGDLIRHPELGVGIEPGSKFPDLNDIRSAVVSTLAQDPRIDRVENIQITRKSDALYLGFDVYVKQVDIPVPVTIKL